MESMPFLRSAYNYDMSAASDESGLKCEDASLTKQSFAEEVDINTIVKRFNLTGQLPVGVRMPTYGDFEVVDDYHSAANAIAQASEAFDAMPAHVRARFHNDPAEFVAFCSDGKNRDEAVKLGLVAPQVQELAAGAPAARVEPPAPVSGVNVVSSSLSSDVPAVK